MKVGILLDHHCQVDAKKQTMVVDGLRGSKPQNNTKKIPWDQISSIERNLKFQLDGKQSSQIEPISKVRVGMN